MAPRAASTVSKKATCVRVAAAAAIVVATQLGLHHVARANLASAPTISPLGANGGVLSVPPDTSQPYYVDGLVLDPRGNGVSGVAVSDGTQTTVTAGDGSWSLPEPTAGSYIVSTASDRLDRAEYRVDAPGVPGVYGAVLTLPYTIGVDSWAVSGTQAVLTIFSSAPRPGTAGTTGASCVRVTDAATGSIVAAQATGKTDTGDAALWTATMPATSTSVVLFASDCGRGRLLSDRVAVSDQAPPSPSTISNAGPQWVNTTNPVVAFTVNDSLSGVNPGSIQVVVDGQNTAVGYDQAAGVYEGQIRGATSSATMHQVDIYAADNAGNVARLIYAIEEDLTPPAVSGAGPVTSASATPLLHLSAVDADSGIDAAACEFVITNGVTSSTLRPTYTAGSRSLDYQVPSATQGASLGQGPLAPGTYTVTGTVTDNAGNEVSTSWSFAVSPAA